MTFFLILSRKDQTWELKLAFSPAYCTNAGAEWMIQRLKVLIHEVIRNPKQALQAINILPEAERQLMLEDFNDTQADYPADKTIVDLFEAQLEKTPNNVAVAFEDRALTYRQLDETASHIAHYLLQHYQIEPDDIIGLPVERSEWMVVGILGIL